MDEQKKLESYQAYLENVRRLADHTVITYIHAIKQFCLWCKQNHCQVLSATKHDIRTYLADMQQSGYAHSTQGHTLTALKAYYDWLIKEGSIASNPCDTVVVINREKPLPRVLTQNEVYQLFAAHAEDTPRNIYIRALLDFLYATGARIAEASALKIGDIDFSSKTVRLFGKGSKERIVPISKEALSSLKRYLDEVRPNRLRMCKHQGSFIAEVFISVQGRVLTPDNLRCNFMAAVKRAGLPLTVTPHVMRHTYATMLLNNGADLRSVQELLGHESLATTQIYTHLSQRSITEASRKAHPRSGYEDESHIA